MEKTNINKVKPVQNAGGGATKAPAPGPEAQLPPFFRTIDWWSFALTTLVVMLGYLYTLAPDVTLEDSGELAVGSHWGIGVSGW